MAEESRERFSKVMEDEGIIAEFNLPETMTVYGDPERIDTILTNFLSNAIDYTDADQHIRLWAEDLGERYRISIL